MLTRLDLMLRLTPIIGGVLVASSAYAGETAVLELSREAGASSWPDERTLSDLVAARLGYEPFDERARLRVRVSFVEVPPEALRAQVELFDADGNSRGERMLVSATGDCEELAATTALTISIMLDPRSGIAPRQAPAPPPPAPKTTALSPGRFRDEAFAPAAGKSMVRRGT